MEQDRYRQNHALYILGIFFLILSMILLVFSVFILPALLYGWQYDIPSFLAQWKYFLQLNYDFGNTSASCLICLAFLLPGLLSVAIAYVASNTIDNQIFGIIPEKNQGKFGIKNTATLILQITLTLILSYSGIVFLQWMISVSP